LKAWFLIDGRSTDIRSASSAANGRQTYSDRDKIERFWREIQHSTPNSDRIAARQCHWEKVFLNPHISQVAKGLP
jgi:hypothetical protein